MKKGEIMGKTVYEKVVLIGFGKIAADVLQKLIIERGKYGYTLEVLEYEPYPTSLLEKYCAESGTEFLKFINDKPALTNRLREYVGRTLIISAGNKFLFPKEVVEMKNLTIVNFHNALLPKFPGRNAPSWAIFEGETESGATWHFVNSGVDTGNILWQGKCGITENTKAYELAKDIMETAYHGFEEIFDSLLCGEIKGAPQPQETGSRKLYYSYEIPGGGVFSESDKPEYIYRLLRSMDYGLNRIFPKPAVRLANGTQAEVSAYKLTGETKNGKKELRIKCAENSKPYIYIYI